MRVVARDGDDAPTLSRQFVPAAQVVCGRFGEARPEQMRVGAVRPETVEEEPDGADVLGVGVQIIDLHAVEAARRLPTVEQLWVGDEDESPSLLRAINQRLR